MIKLPKLISTGQEFHPISLSVSLNITPLSTASIMLPKGENLPARGYVEVFTPLGSAGIFRVRSPEDAYGDETTSAELEHAITEVGDYLVKTEINEMMAATTAMQTIFGYYGGSRWQLGSVSALGSGTIAVEVKYTRVLDAMLAILEQVPNCMMAFNFNTSPWTVSVVARDSTVSAEGRLSRNVSSARVIYDDTELCTRVYYQIPSTTQSGEPTTVWTHRDADTLSTYGLVEREMSTGSDYTTAEANAVADEYLRTHKNPRVTVQIQAEELSQITGEAFDTFQIGKKMRLALPDYNTTVEETITAISFGDVFNSPEDISVQLGQEEDTAITFLHDVDAKGGSGGGGGGKKRAEDTFKEYYTKFEQDDYHISMVAVHQDETDGILQQAGMYLDANGILQYAEDNVKNIGSKFRVQADAITAETQRASAQEGILSGRITVEAGKITQIVQNVGSNGTVTAASIVLAINGSSSSATISADAIDIDGIVTALTAKNVTVLALNAATATINQGVYASTFNVGGSGGYSDIKSIFLDNITLTESSGTYTLKKSINGQETVVGTFSRATTLSGEWSGNVNAGKSYKVTASPQGTTHYSPAIDGYQITNSWASTNASVTQTIKVYDENGEYLFQDTNTINTERAINSVTVTSVGSTQGTSESNTITATASNNATKTRNIHMTGGTTWSSGSTNVYCRLDSTSGTIIARKIVNMPSSATWNAASWTAGGVTASVTVCGKTYTHFYSE